MEKRRPVGMTIVSIIAFMFFLTGLIQLPEELYNGDKYPYVLLDALLSFGWLVAAIGVLKLKKWGRILMLLLAIYDFLYDIVLDIPNFNETITYFLRIFPEFSKQLMTSIAIVAISIEAMLLVIIIVTLTRPKVKEQFR